MKSLKKQRRIQILAIAGACIVGLLALLWFLPDESFQFFRSPSELAASPPPENELFRIGGLVEAGSLQQGDGATVHFTVTDCETSIPVTYTGILPDLFNEDQMMIGQGRYINGTFEAIEILAKHDENYVPPEAANMMKYGDTCAAPADPANAAAVTN
jgi:cytochrome c-type biogenesis protein CcmE